MQVRMQPVIFNSVRYEQQEKPLSYEADDEHQGLQDIRLACELREGEYDIQRLHQHI